MLNDMTAGKPRIDSQAEGRYSERARRTKEALHIVQDHQGDDLGGMVSRTRFTPRRDAATVTRSILGCRDDSEGCPSVEVREFRSLGTGEMSAVGLFVGAMVIVSVSVFVVRSSRTLGG